MTNDDDTPGYYPAVWHSIASLGFQITGVSVPTAANAMALAVSAFIWPLSVIYMMRNFIPLKNLSIILIGISAASFTAFPLLLVYFGVLYPNALGVSLIPVGISVAAQLFRVVSERTLATFPAIFLGFLVILGTAMAHPNSVMSLLVLVLPIVFCRIILQFIKLIKREIFLSVGILHISVLLTLVLIVYYLWGFVRPTEGGGWEPEISLPQAVGEILLQGVMGGGPLWGISFLVCIGVYVTLKQRGRMLWILGAYAVFAYFYIVIRYLPFELGRDEIVGVWYNDAYRVAAMLPVVSIPLVAIAAEWVVRNIYENILPRIKKLPNLTQNLFVFTKYCICITVIIFFTHSMQFSKTIEEYVDEIYWYYALSNDKRLLTEDEIEVFNYVSQNISPEYKFIVNPWTGAGLVYAYTGNEVTAAHLFNDPSENEEILNEELADAVVNPKVCAAAREENAFYVLDFGEREVSKGNWMGTFQGLKNISENPGLSEVYRRGEAALYHLEACATD